MKGLKFAAIRPTVLGLLLAVGAGRGAFGALGAPAQAPISACDMYCLFGRSGAAFQAHRYGDYLLNARRMARRAPSLPAAAVALSRGYALTGRSAAALRQLRRFADLGGTLDLAADPAFSNLHRARAWPEIQERLATNRQPIERGAVAFELPDPDFLPEAFAYDPASGEWLFGSLAQRKVIRLDAEGRARDFIADPRLLRVVGIHVDAARSRLWFATWEPGTSGTSGGAAPTTTRAFQCDRASGRILRVYEPRDGAGHLFNDLALAPNGDVYLTDTAGGAVFRVRSGGDHARLFVALDPNRFTSPNGIAITPDGRTLYVGLLEGVARIDLRARPRPTVRLLPTPARGSAASIGGLYEYLGDLLAVQHVPGVEQVARFRLSANGRSINRIEILERGESLLRRPTTGVVRSDRFF